MPGFKEEEKELKKLLDLITEEMEQAFAKAGYDGKYARVTL